MPSALALCLEDLDGASPSKRYVRCVALVGRRPGLRLSPEGRATWQQAEPVACELWVSADDRLIVYRPQGAPAAVLRRAGRSLELPVAKPVVALDQDIVEVGSKRLRLHVHGRAAKIAAPCPLPERVRSGAARAAAVVALGAAVAACDRPMEIRETPPEPPIDPGAAPPPVVTVPTASSAATGTGAENKPPTIATSEPSSEPTATPNKPVAPSPEPIEVRERPPDMAVDE